MRGVLIDGNATTERGGLFLFISCADLAGTHH